MKIRNGFVSNSSSSSFILMTSQEYWEEVKGDLHPYEIAVAETIAQGPSNFCGIPIVTFSTWYSEGGNWTEYLEVEFEGDKGEYENDADSIYNAWNTVKEKLEQDESKIHKGSTSF